MAKRLSSDEIIAKASKAYIKDYYTLGPAVNVQHKDTLLQDSSVSYDDIKDLFSDHTFNYLVTKIVNSCTVNGYKIVNKKNPSERSVSKEEEFAKLGYDSIERSLFLNLLVYRNAYNELEWNLSKTKVKQLHMLETTEMNINVSPHGEILGYTQLHTGQGNVYSYTPTKPVSQEVFFSPNECVHFALNRLTTNPYGFVDTKAISHVIFWKNKVEEYIEDLFKKKKFRDWWNIKKPVSREQVQAFVESIRQSDSQPDKHIVTEGEVEHNIIRNSDEIKNYTDLLNKYEESISRFLLVPPLLGGDVGTSNRSTGEFEVRYDFSTTVQSIQKVVADVINNKLFPIIGFSRYKLIYNSFDKIDHVKTLNIAAQLKGLGYSSEAIHYYLTQNGIELPEKSEPEEMVVSGNGELNQKLQNLNAKSRTPSDKSQAGNTNVGEASSTREEQVVGKSGRYDSRRYW